MLVSSGSFMYINLVVSQYDDHDPQIYPDKCVDEDTGSSVLSWLSF